MNSSANLVEIAANAGISTKDVWDVLAGETIMSIPAANEIAFHLGISAQTLCFKKSARIRHGVLDWIASHCGVTKMQIWRVMNGTHIPSERLARRLEEFSGIPARAWLAGESWMVDRRFYLPAP